MHARRSVLGNPGDKDTPLSGPDGQLDLYAASHIPLLRTDRLAPASFGPLPQLETSRSCPPQFHSAPTIDYSAELALAERLMSDTDDSLGSAAIGQLTLSTIVPPRAHQPGAKFANAPSRAHNRTSASRFDMRFTSRSGPMTSTPSMPLLSWSSSSSNSSPATTSTKLSVDQPPTTDHQDLSQSDQELDQQHDSSLSPPPTVRPAPAESTALSTPTTTTKRSARTTRRSPAPRRQECPTCGKKFQRPCQLVTHIRSHTGEQPHACPVCSRRFSVLSNCQRHVKLCQKRSAKVLSPGEEDSTNESIANATPFIQFSNDPSNPQPTGEPAARRSHEIPIRPKLASRESGSTNSSTGGGAVGAQRPKPRSGSSSSVGSLALKSEPSSMPTSLERRGSGSVVPVVSSSPAYPQGPYSTSYGYPQTNTYGNYGQGGYESSGSTYGNAYAGSYGSTGSGYDPVTPGFERSSATPGFEQASAAAYDSLNPSFNATSSGYEHSAPAYGTSSPAFDNHESGFNQPHQYPAPAAGPPRLQALPSPSHVQPTPHSAPSPSAASHEAGSYFTSIPGVYAAPSARRPSVTSSVASRRSTIAHTLAQHDAVGFRDGATTDSPNIGPTSDTGAGPPISASGSYYSPSSGLATTPYESQQLKQEETIPDLAHRVWPKEQQSYQTGYPEPQWTPAAGTEASSYHAYHTGSTSSTGLTGPHDNHVASAPTGYAAYPQQQQPQQPQPRQQLYLQQVQGGYSNSPGQQQQQQTQQHDTYGSTRYADRPSYSVNSGVVSVPGHSQNSPDYTWPGSEPAWNEQPRYHS